MRRLHLPPPPQPPPGDPSRLHPCRRRELDFQLQVYLHHRQRNQGVLQGDRGRELQPTAAVLLRGHSHRQQAAAAAQGCVARARVRRHSASRHGRELRLAARGMRSAPQRSQPPPRPVPAPLLEPGPRVTRVTGRPPAPPAPPRLRAGANPACVSKTGLKGLKVTQDGAPKLPIPSKLQGQQAVTTGVKGVISADFEVCIDAAGEGPWGLAPAPLHGPAPTAAPEGPRLRGWRARARARTPPRGGPSPLLPARWAP